MVNFGARRMQIIPLLGYGPEPFNITLNCHAWLLRISVYNPGAALLNGVLIASYGSTDIQGGVGVVLDVPPVFDGRGRTVQFYDTLSFAPNGFAINGVLIQFYFDKDRLAPQGT